MNKCSWLIGKNKAVEFDIFSKLNEGWNAIAGVYIFAYQSPTGWHALYVGQTEDFSARLPNHERFEEAVKLGATHIHATVVQIEYYRDQLGKSLIAIYQPPMNVQHR
jgi:hypothetical protein